MEIIFANKTNQTLLAIAVAILVVAVYYPGLSGPLMLDDNKFIPAIANQPDSLGNFDYLFNNEFFFKRWVALLSFALEINVHGELNTFAMKLTNVVIHLGCGFLIFVLVKKLSLRSSYKNSANYIALATSLWWLLTPENTTAVLYLVQRMAQLSCLFSLAAMICYLIARERIERTQSDKTFIQGLLNQAPLLAATFLLFLLALSSKENALLLPTFLLGIELFFFKPKAGIKSSLFVILLSGYTFVLLAFLVTASITNSSGSDGPGTISILDRLLTETRIVSRYMFDLIIPNAGTSGIYFDNYPPSSSLFNPLTTFFSSLLHIGMWVLMFRCYQKENLAPIGFGLFLFYAGHLIESTVYPLELYFEHRNYLPAIGLYFAVSCAIALAVSRLNNFKSLYCAGVVALFLTVTAVGLFQKTTLWASKEAMIVNDYNENEHSIRAKVDYAQLLTANNYPHEASQVLKQAYQTPYHGKHANLVIQELFIHCIYGTEVPPDIYKKLDDKFYTRPTIEFSTALGNLFNVYQQRKCTNVDMNELVRLLEKQSTERRLQKTGDSELLWVLSFYQALYHAEIQNNSEKSKSVLLEALGQGELRAGYYLMDLTRRFSGPDFDKSSLASEIAQIVNGLEQLSTREKEEYIKAINRS